MVCQFSAAAQKCRNSTFVLPMLVSAKGGIPNGVILSGASRQSFVPAVAGSGCALEESLFLWL